MLRRFVSGSAIAAIVIAFGALVIHIPPAFPQERIYPLVVAWCFVPAIWGLWAMAAPATWVPQRLPLWGGLLGVIAGLVALFVLDIPSRVLGEGTPIALRGLIFALAIVLYFFLWMLVRVVYRSLGASTSVA